MIVFLKALLKKQIIKRLILIIFKLKNINHCKMNLTTTVFIAIFLIIGSNASLFESSEVHRFAGLKSI